MNRGGFLKAVTAALAGAALGPVLLMWSAPTAVTQELVSANAIARASLYLREMHSIGMTMGEALNRVVVDREVRRHRAAFDRGMMRRIQEGLV